MFHLIQCLRLEKFPEINLQEKVTRGAGGNRLLGVWFDFQIHPILLFGPIVDQALLCRDSVRETLLQLEIRELWRQEVGRKGRCKAGRHSTLCVHFPPAASRAVSVFWMEHLSRHPTKSLLWLFWSAKLLLYSSVVLNNENRFPSSSGGCRVGPSAGTFSVSRVLASQLRDGDSSLCPQGRKGQMAFWHLL